MYKMYQIENSSAINMPIGSNMQYSMAEVTSERVMYIKFMIEYSWVRNMFSRSNVDLYTAEVTLEGVNEYV